MAGEEAEPEGRVRCSAWLGIFFTLWLETKVHNPVFECVSNGVLMLNRSHFIIHDRAFGIGTTTTQVKAIPAILVRSNNEKSLRQAPFGSEPLGIAEYCSASSPDAISVNHSRYDSAINIEPCDSKNETYDGGSAVPIASSILRITSGIAGPATQTL